HLMFLLLFFFFQAEDGIRDRNVTGVQTCALPIFYYLNFKLYSLFCNLFKRRNHTLCLVQLTLSNFFRNKLSYFTFIITHLNTAMINDYRFAQNFRMIIN